MDYNNEYNEYNFNKDCIDIYNELYNHNFNKNINIFDKTYNSELKALEHISTILWITYRKNIFNNSFIKKLINCENDQQDHKQDHINDHKQQANTNDHKKIIMMINKKILCINLLKFVTKELQI